MNTSQAVVQLERKEAEDVAEAESSSWMMDCCVLWPAKINTNMEITLITVICIHCSNASLFGCESSPISRNVPPSVRPLVDKCKVRPIKAQYSPVRPSKAQ